jgi:hypothetical protein
MDNVKQIAEKAETALDDSLVWDKGNSFMVVGTYFQTPTHIPETYERVYLIRYNNPYDSTAIGVFNYKGELLGHISKEQKNLCDIEKSYFVNDIFVRTQTDGKIDTLSIAPRRERKRKHGTADNPEQDI